MADLDDQEKQKMIENARRLEEDSTNNFTDQMAISEDFGEVEDDQKEQDSLSIHDSQDDFLPSAGEENLEELCQQKFVKHMHNSLMRS